MKFSIFTVGAPELTPKELLVKLKEYGYDGVEWRVTEASKAAPDAPADFWENNLCTIDETTVVEEAPALKAMCDEMGVEIAALGTYSRCSDYEKAETFLKAASIMGVKRIRISPPMYDGSKPFNEVFEESRKNYEHLEGLAKKYGVKINAEMHMNTITASASSARRLLEGLDPNYIGVIYDVGNMVHEGFEKYNVGLQILGEYLDHVHIKSALWKIKETLPDGTDVWTVDNAPLNKGCVDFRAFFRALKSVGYDGYVSFEDFSKEKTTLEKLKFNIDYIRAIAEEVENEKN